MNAVLEYKDNKFADSSFGITVDVSLDSDKGVFRRYHVGNDPLNRIDPMGKNPIAKIVEFLAKRIAKKIGGKIADKIIGGGIDEDREADDDGDGIINAHEDDDGDGVPNYRDPDSEYCFEMCNPPDLVVCH